MKRKRVPLWLFLMILMAGVGFFTVQTVQTAPQGNARLYMPLLGRAEGAPADYLGLAFSQHPPYPQTPLPDSEIYTVRGDGSALSRLTTNELYDESPLRSPDGSQILWRQTAENPGAVGDYYSALWLMNTDGTDARALTNLPGHEYGLWSPDGTHIFVRSHDPVTSIADYYITTPTAMTPTLMVSGIHWGGAEWSPDGATLAYATYDDTYLYDIYRANSDGSGITRVAEDADQWFDWSPDGAWLVYTKTVADNRDVYLVRADGSETRRLTTDPADNWFTLWVENGDRLLVGWNAGENNTGIDLVSIGDATATPFITGTASILDVSPDGTTVAYLVYAGDMANVFLKSTDGGAALPISSELLCYNVCSIFPGGWSATGRYFAYQYHRSVTASTSYNRLYLVSLENGPPTYRLLMDENAFGVQWLPHSDWFSAYAPWPDSNGYRLQLFNARTNARFPLPLSDNGRTLVLSEWQYDGSE